jgi:molecular chaperone DnaJ
VVAAAKHATYSSESGGPASKDDDPATHKNEGFLKSIWHNLTNHPAHQKPPSGEESNTENSSEKKKSGDDPK